MHHSSPDFQQELVMLPESNFLYHLGLPNNNRIIFSGPFGTGKTTFLKYFFEKSKYHQKYKVIHLSPVNYSIMSNEDVFKYIKYDILYELINTHQLDLIAEVELTLEEMKHIASNNILDILKLFILTIPGLGKQYHQWGTEMQKLANKINEEASEGNQVKAFMQPFASAGFYESDIITTIISKSVAAFSANQAEQPVESILIIDDLDRLDPDHIFRLFNVYSAHFDDRQPNCNKFNFDKIIFVCDIDNIRNIFHHRYGANTDFSGYIDKFYSTAIFQYRNTNEEEILVTEFLKSLAPSSDESLSHYFNSGALTIQRLHYILVNAAYSDLINLRALLKYKGNIIPIAKKEIELIGGARMNSEFPMLILIEALVVIFGSAQRLDEVFEILGNKSILDGYDKLGRDLPDILLIINIFKINTYSPAPLNYEVGASDYTFSIVQPRMTTGNSLVLTKLIGKEFISHNRPNALPYNFIKLLHLALKNLRAHNYF